tara:strand:+ start:1357 stop:2466 length:1110 start_codon:yes stop_codon:yes gene_type:complete
VINFKEFYEIILEGGAVGHMAHPFDLPQVKTGNDLIELFNKTVKSLTTNPGAIKIDGVNTSIKLVDAPDGGKEFALDRGSMKDLDIRGIRAKGIDPETGKSDLESRFTTKDGTPHGMIQTGGKVLAIFNSAIPSIETELKALGLWKDKNIILNMEYVSGKTNVQEYEGDFLAIHGLNKFEQVTPRRRASSEISFKAGPMKRMIDKLNPIAAEHGFKVLGSVDTQLEGEVDFSSALQERITIKYNDDKEETRTLQGWLADAKNPFKQVVNLAGGGKDTAMTKKMYFAVMNGQNLLDIVDEKDVGWVVSGAVMYHATRTLGNVLLAAVNSEIGTADTQEGIVVRDKNIAKVPYKITGEFIVRGMESQFRQA